MPPLIATTKASQFTSTSTIVVYEAAGSGVTETGNELRKGSKVSVSICWDVVTLKISLFHLLATDCY